MGWSFRRSKSFGLFRLNFSKSGVGFSVGVPGARVGVNSKGKKYVRGGIPGTGIYYQSSLPDAQHPQLGETPQSSPSVSPVAIIIMAFLVVGLIIIYAMSSSTPTTKSAPVVRVPQVVAPVAAPVAPKHVVKHKRKHAAHRAPATGTKPEEAPAAEPANKDTRNNGHDYGEQEPEFRLASHQGPDVRDRLCDRPRACSLNGKQPHTRFWNIVRANNPTMGKKLRHG